MIIQSDPGQDYFKIRLFETRQGCLRSMSRRYPYRFQAPCLCDVCLKEQIDWCNEQFGERLAFYDVDDIEHNIWPYHIDETTNYKEDWFLMPPYKREIFLFMFRNQSDAAYFKMTWF